MRRIFAAQHAGRPSTRGPVAILGRHGARVEDQATGQLLSCAAARRTPLDLSSARTTRCRANGAASTAGFTACSTRTVLPTILRNFDRVSMAHGIEVRMPFMDWRLVTYTMALPEDEQTCRWPDQNDRPARNGRPHAGIDPNGPAQDRLQFADAGMAERAAVGLGRARCWRRMCRPSRNWLTKRACAARSPG